MKHLIFSLLIVSSSLWAQDPPKAEIPPVEVIPYEKLAEHDLSDEKIDQLSALSKNHVIKSSENQITKDELELVDVELVYEQEPIIFSKTPTSLKPSLDATPLCFPQQSIILYFLS